MSDVYDKSVIADLSMKVAECCESDKNRQKKRRWEAVCALQPQARAVMFYFYQYVWQREFAEPGQCSSGISSYVEAQLRFRLWRWEHLDDDTPILPYVLIPTTIMDRSPFSWNPVRECGVFFGLDARLKTAEQPDGAYKEDAPLDDVAKLIQLKCSGYRENETETNEMLARAEELLGGRLPVLAKSDQMHWGPFEYAVALRGMSNLLFDFVDDPGFVHELMTKITTGLIEFHREREALGRVDARASFIGHIPYDCIPEDKIKKLAGCWVKIHAQSSGSISPDMYAEFIHPYHCQLAELVGAVYYHGCEDLSHKYGIIQTLPNLKLFHISPWSPEQAIFDKIGGRHAFEIHSHPTELMEGSHEAAIRDKLKTRHELFRNLPHTLALADIERVNGRLDRLQQWIATAQEIADS